MAMLKIASAHDAGRIEDGTMPCIIRPPRRNIIDEGDALHLFLQLPGRAQQRVFPALPEYQKRPPGAPWAVKCVAIMPLTVIIAPAREGRWFIDVMVARARNRPTVFMDIFDTMELVAKAAGELEGGAAANPALAVDQFAAYHYPHCVPIPSQRPDSGIRNLEILWWDDPARHGFCEQWWLANFAASGAAAFVAKVRQPKAFAPALTALEDGDAVRIWRKRARQRLPRPRFASRTPISTKPKNHVKGGARSIPGPLV